MSILTGFMYSLAAKALMEAGKSSPRPSAIIPSNPSTTAISVPSSSGGLIGPGPIPRNFRIQVVGSNKQISASDDYSFGIDGITSQTCNGNDCGKYQHTTTFTIANGYAQLYNGAGKQQTVFIDRSTGTLQYQDSIGSPVPSTALRTGIVVRPMNDGTFQVVYNDSQDRTWTVCTGTGGSQYIGSSVVGQCRDGSVGQAVQLQAVEVSDPGAFLYGPASKGA